MFDSAIIDGFQDEFIKIAAGKADVVAALKSAQRVAKFGKKYSGRTTGISKAVKPSDLVAPVAEV